MKRYIALLRGINVGGKNKLPMADLKKEFVNLDFSEVVTYLNSGNIIFSTEVDTELTLADQIQEMISTRFDLDIPVDIIAQDELRELLTHAPGWWGTADKSTYDNLIFMLPSLSYEKFYDTVGAPKETYEQVENYQNIIFWSFDRANYQKTNWWSKTASSDIRNDITIRTANTVRKIIEL